jgi:hypothetical protein
MKTISKKKVWVSINAWRGYQKPVNAIAGANDTGVYPDSPCKSNIRKDEIGRAKSLLRKNGIRFSTTWGQTSNVFCVSQYILVNPDDRQKATEVIEPIVNECQLLFLCD